MNSKKIIFIIAAVLSFIAGCDDKFRPTQTNVSTEDSPTQESWNSTVIFSDSGKTKAVMEAGHISVYSNKGYTLIDSGAKVDFFNDDVKVSTLTGRRAKIDDKTKDIEIFDSIKVINYEGSELTTQKLLWTNKTQRVSSDVFVRIVTPTEAIEGVGFESDQNLKNYKIFKVSGTFSN